ncbi:MAG: hypothetical protein KFF73_01365 [Cyclobacteriaceae bacterium]|nr:hypothetical protein [Cyclobacteriaceae bacterium]
MTSLQAQTHAMTQSHGMSLSLILKRGLNLITDLIEKEKQQVKFEQKQA